MIIPISVKIDSDHSSFILVSEIQLDHSHGIINKTTTMTAKHNKIESTNVENRRCDILCIFVKNSSHCDLLLFIMTDFGRFVGVVTN